MITSKDICIRELKKIDLVPNLLEHFHRYQKVVRVWRIKNGEKIIVENPFIEEWDEALKREIVHEDLTYCIEKGGAVWAVFSEGKVIGFAALLPTFFGSKKQYVQLMQLHISHEYRGWGLGRQLFFLCAEKAKTWGAKKLYISGHSAVETQKFYKNVGCVDAQEINKELAEHEPYDIQLEYTIY